MPWIDLPGGGRAHVRMSTPRPKACTVCGARGGMYLCDWPMGNGKTCNRRLCIGDRRHVGPDVDYCPEHFAAWRAARGAPEPPQGPPQQAELF